MSFSSIPALAEAVISLKCQMTAEGQRLPFSSHKSVIHVDTVHTVYWETLFVYIFWFQGAGREYTHMEISSFDYLQHIQSKVWGSPLSINPCGVFQFQILEWLPMVQNSCHGLSDSCLGQLEKLSIRLWFSMIRDVTFFQGDLATTHET